MGEKTKRLMKRITPPFIYDPLQVYIKYIKFKEWQGPGEKDAAWYDKAFEFRDFLAGHYTLTEHFFIFSLIADRIMRSQVERILDIGCGAGQLACLLRDRGLKEYTGFDFSPKRIAQARKICPEFRFELADAFNTDLYQTVSYDGIVCSEFLEHVENDTGVLKKCPPGKRFYGTVPNYPLMNHVRYFKNVEEVAERYRPFFSTLSIDRLLRNPQGKVFYLLEGITA